MVVAVAVALAVGKGGGEQYRGASTPSPIPLRASLLRRLRYNSCGSAAVLASNDQKALDTEPNHAGENHSADLSAWFSCFLRPQCISMPEVAVLAERCSFVTMSCSEWVNDPDGALIAKNLRR